MGLFSLFSKKTKNKKPKIEKVKGDICAKSGYKPDVTVQVFAGMDSQYLYLVGNEFVIYEIGKYDTSNIKTYENRELSGQGMIDYLNHTKAQGFTNIAHVENGIHNALVESGANI